MVHESTERKLKSFSANLKDETQIVIREAVIQDAADLIRCVRSYISDSEHMVMEADEFAPDIAQGREFIHNFLESENSILIVATHNDRIIGNLDITGGRRNRLRHTGLVGMGMLNEYREKGLGGILLQTGISWAVKNNSIEKLWLQILANNLPAINLYRKMGFEEEGRQKNFVRLDKETYYDNILMSLWLK
ncbi:MAG TPA: GNAT family N-acetyltransferase [Flavipsychrobacter sp.]|mgnify:CR=1 FL=1|nr:GNAT family N-acetyltransferase [Flavipsychrobacter sp.]